MWYAEVEMVMMEGTHTIVHKLTEDMYVRYV